MDDIDFEGLVPDENDYSVFRDLVVLMAILNDTSTVAPVLALYTEILNQYSNHLKEYEERASVMNALKTEPTED